MRPKILALIDVIAHEEGKDRSEIVRYIYSLETKGDVRRAKEELRQAHPGATIQGVRTYRLTTEEVVPEDIIRDYADDVMAPIYPDGIRYAVHILDGDIIVAPASHEEEWDDEEEDSGGDEAKEMIEGMTVAPWNIGTAIRLRMII